MYMRKCTSLRCSANAHKTSCSCGKKKKNQAERQAILLRGNYREKRRLGSFVIALFESVIVCLFAVFS